MAARHPTTGRCRACSATATSTTTSSSCDSSTTSSRGAVSEQPAPSWRAASHRRRRRTNHQRLLQLAAVVLAAAAAALPPSASAQAAADAQQQQAGTIRGSIAPPRAAASCQARAATPSFPGITVSATLLDRAAGGGGGDNAGVATAAEVRADGTFELAPLLPGGRYELRASHPRWQLQPVSAIATAASLEQEDGSAVLPGFSLVGYRLTGAVTSDSGPVAGIQVTLLADDDNGVRVGCSATHPPGAVHMADIAAALSTTPLCSVLTDAGGRYAFDGVPCGKYTLQASHPGTDSAFDIQPPSLVAAVGQGDAVAPRDFTVTGFSVSGRVVDSAGDGVAGVSVLVAGEERASTDLNGRYVLRGVQEGRLSVAASHAMLELTSLQAVAITPSAQTLPDILVTKSSICGRVSWADRWARGAVREVEVASIGAGGVNGRTSLDGHARFCFLVPVPGTYRVSPMVPAAATARGLVPRPRFTDVELRGPPVTHLAFGQASVALSGSVACGPSGAPCPEDVLIQLYIAGRTARLASGKLSQFADSTVTADGRTTFRFAHLRPLTHYVMTASRPGWCWAGAVDAEVGDEDAEAPPLRQAGFELQVTTDRAVDLTVLPGADEHHHHLGATDDGDTAAAAAATAPPSDVIDVALSPLGPNDICLPRPGTFNATPRGCYAYSATTFPVTATASGPPLPPLHLAATGVFVTGQVHVSVVRDAPQTALGAAPAPRLPHALTVRVEGLEHELSATTVLVNPEARPAVYSYTLLLPLAARAGAPLRIRAVAPPGVGSAQQQEEQDQEHQELLTFAPDSVTYQLVTPPEGCPPPVPTIQGRLGSLGAGRALEAPAAAAEAAGTAGSGGSDPEPASGVSAAAAVMAVVAAAAAAAVRQNMLGGTIPSGWWLLAAGVLLAAAGAWATARAVQARRRAASRPATAGEKKATRSSRRVAAAAAAAAAAVDAEPETGTQSKAGRGNVRRRRAV